MNSNIFLSKRTVLSLIGIFCFYLFAASYVPASPAALQDVNSVFEEAVDLYYQAKFLEAIDKFKDVMVMTQNKTILVDTYFYLSICYLYIGESANSKEYIKMLLRNDPSREVSDEYPSEYRALFNKAKAELQETTAPKPPEPVVEKPVVQQPPPPKYTPQPPEQKKKKSKAPLFIIGGTVLAGGAVAAIILLGEKYGSIQVSSTPAGASIYLDGTDSGQVTPATIEDVEPGSYTVGVRLDGYVNYSETVNVEKKLTANVNVNLTAHTISVTNPSAGDLWGKGRDYNIRWTVSGSGGVNVMLQPLGSSDNPVAPSSRLLANRSRAIHSRTMANSNVQKSADSKLSFGSKEYRTKDLAASGLALDRPNLKNPHMPALPQLRLRAPGDAKPMDIANTKITLRKGGSVVRSISDSTPNDGSHPWTLPNGIANAKNYRIRVSSSKSSEVFGQSNSFTIWSIGDIQCNSSPTGADVFLDGDNTGSKTNIKLENIPVGNHYVKYEMDRFFDYSQQVYVPQNSLKTVSKDLDPTGFFEQFPGTALYWEKDYGSATWSPTGGVYRSTNCTSWTSAFYKAGSAEFPRKYRWEVRCRRTSGPTTYWRSIAFGGNNNHSKFYAVRFAENGYAVVRWTNFPNSGYWIQYPTYSPYISGGGWNTVEVQVNGTQVKVYFNGVLHYQTNISGFPDKGSIGLVAAHGSSSHKTDFDDARLSLTSKPSSEKSETFFSEPMDFDFSNIPITKPTIVQFENRTKKKK